MSNHWRILHEINKLYIDNTGDEDVLEMFSQDHDGMFPSLHIPTVCQIAADDFCNSNLELEDVVELLLYLTIVLDR